MQNGCSSLTLASLRGHHETVEVLLKYGADANAKDKIVSAGRVKVTLVRTKSYLYDHSLSS